MTYRSALAAFALPLTFSLLACSPAADQANNASPVVTEGNMGSAAPSATTAQNVSSASPSTTPSPKVIGLEGLGDLRIGEPVPKDSLWKARGAQTGDACRTVSSPDYPGAYAIVTEGKVQRITIGQRSDVKLVEGIGVGATEKDVRKWFAGFREEAHKYDSAPAKYLTAPNAANSESALRFEIGPDGKVSMIHVGRMPVLAYVEGCA